jgi:hypothetical protein
VEMKTAGRYSIASHLVLLSQKLRLSQYAAAAR